MNDIRNPRLSALLSSLLTGIIALSSIAEVRADAPDASKLMPVKLFEVDHLTEGVCFDYDGNGYISEGAQIIRFAPDGSHKVWAITGAPDGHKVLADGTHLVCDTSQHAILHLTAEGKPLAHASQECDGQPFRSPNDLTLDTPNAGFYFTDTEINAIYYVDRDGKTHQVDKDLARPNGILLSPDGKRLYVGECPKNRVLVYDVPAAGKPQSCRVFAELPAKDPAAGQIDDQPDGICLDAAGNLYVAHYGMRQVQVLDPAGKLIARYPGGTLTTTNVAFGGPKLDQLFVTGALASKRGALFRIDLGVPGLSVLPEKKQP